MYICTHIDTQSLFLHIYIKSFNDTWNEVCRLQEEATSFWISSVPGQSTVLSDCVRLKKNHCRMNFVALVVAKQACDVERCSVLKRYHLRKFCTPKLNVGQFFRTAKGTRFTYYKSTASLTRIQPRAIECTV